MIKIELHPEISEEQILSEIRQILKEYPHSTATVLSQGGGLHLMVKISPLTYIRRFYKACYSLFPTVCKAELMLEKMGREGDLTYFPQTEGSL